MRFLIAIFIVLSLAGAALADNKNSVPDSEPLCSSAGHNHGFSDIRIAAVEITSVDNCGFSYVDLEENTVGLDNHFVFDSSLEIIQIEKKAKNSGLFQTIGASPRDIKRGMLAVAVYCAGCRAVLNLRSLTEDELASRGWKK